MATADWLAADIDPARATVAELLTDPTISLDNLRKAKDVYKTMRILGETADDRCVAANLYAASIGAALLFHGERISRQSDSALHRGLESLQMDKKMPQPLRDLARAGLGALNGSR